MKNKIISLILILVLILPNIGSAQSSIKEYEPKADIVFFQEILTLIQRDYPFEIEENDLIEGAVKGMLQSVDPYSDYYTREEAEEMFSDVTGNFSGIGVYIEEKDDYINIVRTIKDQPADKVGLQKDDLIIEVEGKDIKGMELEQVSSIIKGKKGTRVKLKIKRNGKFLTFNIVRDNIEINPLSYEIIDDDIGYISLEKFNSQATKEIKKALSYFKEKDISKIILDLRDNPGGLFYEAIEVAKLFVPKGNIVHQRGKDKKVVSYASYRNPDKYELVLLVNENSASAAEIVAGAIKDRKAGEIVGRKTFGKGIIQSMIPITGGSIVKLTTAEYLTPNKKSIHGKGIEPDIEIENTTLDLQLEKAIEILQQVRNLASQK